VRRHRHLAKASLLALSLLLTQGEPATAEKLRVGKSSAVGFTFFPLDVGIEKGIFAKNGLEIELIQLGGSAKLHQAAVAGAIDLGLGAGTDVAFVVKGAPETVVGAIALSPALFGIVLLNDSPVKTVNDLKGKRIGVSTVGSLTQWIIFQLAKKQGWKRDDIVTVPIGSETTPQLAAMQTRQVDAVLSAAAFGLNLEQQGRGRLLMPASEIVGSFLMNVIFATNAAVKDNPDGIRRFLKAWYETVDAMWADKPGTVQITRAITHYAQEVEEKEYDTVMPSFSRDGQFPPSAVAKVQESFVELEILEKEPDMSRYLTTTFLPKRN
jgi:NitT/TauT family transport system substrate-binding protein